MKNHSKTEEQTENAPVSPWLQRLGELQGMREQCNQKRVNLSEPINRLKQVSTEVETLRTKIDEFDRDETRRLAEWAQSGGVGDPPTADTDEREKLLQQLSELERRAANAARAESALIDQQQALALESSQIANSVTEAAANIVLDRANEAATAVLERFEGLRQEMAAIAGARFAASLAANEIKDHDFEAYRRLVGRINEFPANALIEISNMPAETDEWEQLLEKLRR